MNVSVAIPLKVVRLNGKEIIVKWMDGKKKWTVSTALLKEPVAVGDFVNAIEGYATEVVSLEEARGMIRYFRNLPSGLSTV